MHKKNHQNAQEEKAVACMCFKLIKQMYRNKIGVRPLMEKMNLCYLLYIKPVMVYNILRAFSQDKVFVFLKHFYWTAEVLFLTTIFFVFVLKPPLLTTRKHVCSDYTIGRKLVAEYTLRLIYDWTWGRKPTRHKKQTTGLRVQYIVIGQS